jgi:lysophospholipase L1-like esterase
MAEPSTPGPPPRVPRSQPPDALSGPAGWHRYVALGDSFTEGLIDPGPDGVHRGWADRLAGILAAGPGGPGGLSARSGGPGRGLEYANLAVRGRLLGQIAADQVAAAVDLKPDLVSIVGGGNDVLRPGSDPDALAARLDDAVHTLRGNGADVLMATPVDPVNSALIRLTRGKAAVLAAHVWSIGRRHGAFVIDLWGMSALQDRRMWAADRIHLTGPGHQRVAWQAAEVLGLGRLGDWATPLPPAPAPARGETARQNIRWARQHVGPWAVRRLRGRSSGDSVRPKRPDPTHLGPDLT